MIMRKVTKKAGRQSPRTRRKKKTRRPRNIIIKRTGGRREKFDKEKMAQTVSRSGTPFAMARDVARTVSRKIARGDRALKVKMGSSEAEIDARAVRDMVVEELRRRNRPDIAASLAGERPENTRQERHELEDRNEPVLDNVAANRSRLLFDGSTRFAKSTKQQG
jgi:hypothetical protein